MAHYHERDRVHAAPPEPARGSDRTARIDCDTCPIAGRGCGGCMVALLGPVRLRLDGPEQRAVDTLVAGGLVAAAEAEGAYAVPDLPDWVVATWPARTEQAQRLQAIG